MKANNLDELFKKKKTSNISFYLKITIIVFAMLVLFFIPFFISNLINADKKSYEIKTNGEQYGNSEFIKYQGKISVAIPSGGRYILDDADVNSFRTLNSEDRSTRIIGLDKNHVYFGNIAISDLDPNKLKVIGNGYYTDGTATYFCSPVSERNKKLSVPMEILQSLTYAFSKTKRAQDYIYPYRKVETDKKIIAVQNFSFFATDGEKVYYEGEILENADLNTLKSVDGYNEYFADKENVYYKSKLLPIKNSGKLIVVSTEQGDEFLYDGANGYVFIEDYSFDREKAPYKVIGNNGNHLYNLAFVNNEGIYYYDDQEKKQLKAGDNIFIGNIEEISPNIFTDDKNIYYFHAYDVWKNYKNGGSVLFSRNTEIYYLDKKDGWEKVKDIRSGIIGGIWKKGNRYYYFDNLGIFQLIDNVIYEIRDKETLEYLLNYNEGSSKIGELIENGKLIKIEGEKKMEIVVKHKNARITMAKYSKIFLAIVIIASIIIRLLKGLRNEKKF
ncbi:DKNYY domain-containing protein [Fusobacterium canifelinum]|uniref:DKNYY domain-containing protein n=1 Tax=Fusobacterium canifelinum TaxID=285729 RepID=A0ABX7CMC4_9FUSO|nr:DKNYY domain-containing protein [Fusobacterium canifelinum]QQS88514.1 DKNYY domain-containing protein [Fusobacterium canifelinum]